MEPIGIVGVGQIGLAVAERLITSNLATIGYRRSSLEAFTSLGGIAANAANEVVEKCSLSLECLPNEPALFDVIQRLPDYTPANGKTIISLSSHSLVAKEEANRRLGEKNITYLDGEVSGIPDMVRAGRASLFVSGDAETYSDHQKTLEAISPNLKFLGDFGAATKMKLIANQMIMIHTLASAEAIALAEKMGLDPFDVIETLGNSPASSEMFRFRAPLIANRAFDDSQASIATMQKYADLIEAEVAAKAIAAPLSISAVEWFRKANDTPASSQDISAVFRLLNSVAK